MITKTVVAKGNGFAKGQMGNAKASARLEVAEGNGGNGHAETLVLKENGKVMTLTVDDLKPRTITFSPMSINIVTIPDDAAADHRVVEYTMKMADAGLPPKATR